MTRLSRRQYLAGALIGLVGCVDGNTGGTDPPSSGVTGSWTHSDGNAAGTNASGTTPLDSAPDEQWSRSLGVGYPAVRFHDDNMYVPLDQDLVRLSLADGSDRWSQSFEEFPRLTATVGDRLYVTTGDSDPTARALAVPDGQEPTEEWSKPGVRGRRADEDIVVGGNNDNTRLSALDPDGSERWTITPDEIAEDAEYVGPVVLDEERVIVVAEQWPSTGWVAGLDRENGEIRWSGLDPNQNTVLAVGPDVVVSAGNEDGATGWSPDGSELWQVETGARITSTAIVDDRVLLNDETGSTTAYTTRGDEMWSLAGKRIAAVDNEVAYAVGDGVRALGIEDGDERWALDQAADWIIPANGGLFTLTRADSGEVTLRLHQ